MKYVIESLILAVEYLLVIALYLTVAHWQGYIGAIVLHLAIGTSVFFRYRKKLEDYCGDLLLFLPRWFFIAVAWFIYLIIGGGALFALFASWSYNRINIPPGRSKLSYP